MKKLLVLFSVSLISILCFSQMEGWPLLPNEVHFTPSTPYATPIVNGYNYSYYGSEGAYDASGNLLFYTVLGSGDIYEPGSINSNGALNSFNDIFNEQSIIMPIPGQNLKYFVIYSTYATGTGGNIAYATVDCNNNNVSITNAGTSIKFSDWICGLAATNIGGNDYLYACNHNDGLQKFNITGSSISFNNTLLDDSHPDFDSQDLSTSFIDISPDNSKLAFLNFDPGQYYRDLIIVNLNSIGDYVSHQIFAVDPNTYGHVRGIQFSSEPSDNILYFSATGGSSNGGIFALEVSNGSITVLSDNNEFGNTWLSTASDGLIYAVANDGTHLCRIDPRTNTFDNNILTVNVNSNDDINGTGDIVYHLPTSSTYISFSVTGSAEDETCSGYSDGMATAIPEGGVPPYSYLWDDPSSQTSQTATGLAPGTYTCQVTDDGGRERYVSVTVITDPDIFNYTGPFTITSPVEWNQVDYQIDHDIIIGNGGSLLIKNSSNVDFDYLAGFIVQSGGELIIQDNSSFSGLADCGYNNWNGIQVHDLGYCEVSTMSIRDCISYVHEDGTLRVTENGMLTLQAGTKLNIESFGYLCVDETATLNLVASNSVLNLETDYIMGVNPNLNITPAPNCADICTINQIGQGYINIDENYDFHYEVTISNDETWTNENYRLKYNLTVEDGATLNLINSSVHFADNGKIIIEKGGKIIANNSTFDRIDMCLFDMWQGIEVHGDINWHQFPDNNGNYYQGYLELNNSTIENAKNAVNLWNPYAAQPYQTTGGIIRAIGSTFSNNAKSIHALYYDNYHPNFIDVQMDYSAYFKDCTFEITEEYFNTYTFYKHVDLNHVDGVKFRGCDFTLSPLAQNVQEWNKGIAAYNSGFDALAYCTSTTQPCPDIDYNKCTFTGFYRGIFATGDLTTINNSMFVNRAVFNNNALGAEIVGVHNPIVINCDFNIGFNNTTDQTDCLLNNSFGIYLDGSTGFAIEENEFAKFTGAQQANYFGIVVKESRAVNEIYKNEFDGISYANYSEGRNWGYEYREGLAYFCNENYGNYADFFVEDADDSGVQDNQGNDEIVAGNKFSQTGATWHFYNGGIYRVGYHYCDFCPDENPDDNKMEYTSEEPENFDNACLSHYGGGAVVKSAQQKYQLEQEYLTNLTDYNSVKSIYDSYIDGGDTEGELLDIQTAQPDDMWALRAQLLGDSPHLSQEVLMEASDRTDVFPDDVLLEILSANPDELKKDSLISYLENKEDPLPEYMIDILIAVSTGTTYKTVLEHQMSKYKRNMVRACHDMIRSIINDSVCDYVELRNWLDNLGGIRADKQIIASYVEEGNYTDALKLANMLPQLYSLSSSDSLEHSYFMDMLNLHQLLNQQGRNTMQLAQSEIDLLADIAANSNSTAGAQARGLLEYAYDYHFACCPNVEADAGYKNQGVNMNTLSQAYGLEINVNPNPAREWATFDYTLPSAENNAVIYITDVSGKSIVSLPVSGRQGKKTWDTRDVDAGVYIYTLKASGMSKSGKIIIN